MHELGVIQVRVKTAKFLVRYLKPTSVFLAAHTSFKRDGVMRVSESPVRAAPGKSNSVQHGIENATIFLETTQDSHLHVLLLFTRTASHPW